MSSQEDKLCCNVHALLEAEKICKKLQKVWRSFSNTGKTDSLFSCVNRARSWLEKWKRDRSKEIEDVGIQFHYESCQNCRYFRIHKTGCFASECLLRGRTLGLSNEGTFILHDWAREKVCNFWKRRPKTWNIYSEGINNDPFWKDPYIPRKTLKNLRKKYRLCFTEQDEKEVE